MADLFDLIAPERPPAPPPAPTPPSFPHDTRLQVLDAFASKEDLADPAFCAVYDVVHEWTVWAPGRVGASFALRGHVERIVRNLRERGLLAEGAHG